MYLFFHFSLSWVPETLCGLPHMCFHFPDLKNRERKSGNRCQIEGSNQAIILAAWFITLALCLLAMSPSPAPAEIVARGHLLTHLPPGDVDRTRQLGPLHHLTSCRLLLLNLALFLALGCHPPPPLISAPSYENYPFSESNIPTSAQLLDLTCAQILCSSCLSHPTISLCEIHLSLNMHRSVKDFAIYDMWL